MRKRLAAFLGLAVALILVVSPAACAKKSETQAEKASPPPAAEQAAPTAEPAAVPAVDSTAATNGDVAAVHDCAGGCGMTAVPEAQMTAIDGKWYCAGCAKGMQQGAHNPG